MFMQRTTGASMRGLIEVPLETGGCLLVEVDEDLEPGVVRVGRAGEVAATARQTLETSLDQLKPLATAVIDRLRGLAHPPHEVNVEFGVKLTAHAGMVIAASGGEANLTVRLCWGRPGALG
jgi:hypothetical protein